MKTINPKLAQLVMKIPKGRVTTYNELAKASKLHPRVVGRQLSKNKDLENIPCYRVVHSDGSIGGYALGRDEKIKRLKEDNIEVNNGKVDLGKYKYKGIRKVVEVGPGADPRLTPLDKNTPLPKEQNPWVRKKFVVEEGQTCWGQAKKGTAQNLPFRNESRDIVEMHNVISAPSREMMRASAAQSRVPIENVNRITMEAFEGSREKAIDEACRVLKKKGRLILTNDHPADQHVLDKVISYAEQHGFKVLSCKPTQIMFLQGIRETTTAVLEKV